MRLLRPIGALLLLAGLALVGWGLFHALRPIVGMYQTAMTDPLSDAMPDDGKAVVAGIWKPLSVAGAGAVLGTTGSTLLVIGKRSRRARAAMARPIP